VRGDADDREPGESCARAPKPPWASSASTRAASSYRRSSQKGAETDRYPTSRAALAELRDEDRATTIDTEIVTLSSVDTAAVADGLARVTEHFTFSVDIGRTHFGQR